MMQVIPELLTKEACAEIRESLNAAEFVDGRVTAGKRAAKVKKNEQVDAKDPEKVAIQEKVLAALNKNALFQRFALPKKVNRPLLSRYKVGMEYGLHVDNPLMLKGAMRTDLSLTVFLNEKEDYEGGELEILSGFGAVNVKLAAGACVVYPSSTLHRVKPVTKGERLAAVTWVQSRVRDAGKREVLFDLAQVKAKMAKLAPDADETARADRAHANLARMWSEL